MFSSLLDEMNHMFKLWKTLGSNPDTAFELTMRIINKNQEFEQWFEKYKGNVHYDSAGIYLVDLDLPMGNISYETEEDFDGAF